MITRHIKIPKNLSFFLFGPRQTGKSTLIHMVYTEDTWFVDLLLNDQFLRYDKDPSLFRKEAYTKIKDQHIRHIVIDEIQRVPQLFETLRPLADRPETPARFLVLGSASPRLVRGVSESLAGRSLFTAVPGFSLEEVGVKAQNQLWARGQFPRSWLAESEAASNRWREAFIATFLERDIPQLGIRVPSESLRRFWTMLAHYHGQVWNASELARSIGASSKTALHYRDILAGGYVLRVLPPWFENLKKRQVKSPKIYIRDSGILHTLLRIPDMDSLRSHPRYGASWEGFALEQILVLFGDEHAYFWSTRQGAELDLLLFVGKERWGFEFKCSDAPSMTKSIHVALQDLGLERVFIVYPGKQRYRIHEKVEVIPLTECIHQRDFLLRSDHGNQP